MNQNTLLVIFLMLSSLANVWLLWLYLSRKKQPTPTQDASELLADILRGGALVHVKRICPEDVLLRSPRR